MEAYAAVLAEQALILNSNWVPIRVGTVREAIVLAAKGTAKIVLPETFETFDFDSWASLAVERDKPHIRTVRLRLRVPEVVLLTTFGGTPAQTVVFSRRNLFKRDRYQCQYCGVQPGAENLTVDHVAPKARGGLSSWENCVLACVECNKRKANRTPIESGMKLRRRPVRPKWSPVLTLALGRRRESWEGFISRAYWDVPLEP